jgi:hypothetical protein
MRSGFRNPHLGQHLGLHPSVIVPAVFPVPIQSAGPVQPWICRDLQNLDGQGRGVILENSFFPPGLAAMSLPWRNQREFSDMIQSLQYWSGTLILARDSGQGSVALNAQNRPSLRYRLGRDQRIWIHRGIELATRWLLEAKASAVYGPFWDYDAGLAVGNESQENRSERPRPGLHRNLKLWSAHQFGTCRMADSPQRGVVTPFGQVYGLSNVFVCDSSVLPTAPGVNPMVSICTMSHFLAQQIKDRYC